MLTVVSSYFLKNLTPPLDGQGFRCRFPEVEATERVPQVIVRRAISDDIPWLKASLPAIWNGNPSNRVFFNDSKFAEYHIKDMIDNHLVLIAEQGGAQIGLISGMVMNHPWVSPPGLLVLMETHWWVTESHRGGRAGLLLLKAFVQWGEKNVDRISMTIAKESAISERALTKRGFEFRERTFSMEIN